MNTADYLPGELGDLVGKDAEELSEKDFDPRGQYKAVIKAVKDAGSEDVGFFKVKLDRTRSEYLVVSVDSKHGRLVGLKALAIES